jgi:uncharacterized coiled-coil protein SlyX
MAQPLSPRSALALIQARLDSVEGLCAQQQGVIGTLVPVVTQSLRATVDEIAQKHQRFMQSAEAYQQKLVALRQHYEQHPHESRTVDVDAEERSVATTIARVERKFTNALSRITHQIPAARRKRR